MNLHQQPDWMAIGRSVLHSTTQAPPDGAVSRLLSATSYTPPDVIESAPTGPGQLFGGVIITEDQQEQVAQRPKKRSRTAKADSAESNDGSDEGNKKQRGRPRVDNRDETAIDRRRTQIRLAQRAYRDRKESTITTLQRKVDDMKARFKRMEKAFKALQSELEIVEGIDRYHRLKQHLELLHDEFGQINDTAILDHALDDEQRAKNTSQGRNATTSADRTIREEQVPLASDTLSDPLSDPLAGYPAKSYPSTSSAGSDLRNVSAESSAFNGGIASSASRSYFDTNPNMNQVKAPQSDEEWLHESLDLERAFPLRSSYTYSFQETSLARRLHRLTIEQAFRNLANPNTDPTWIARTFHFALSVVNKQQLRMKFKEILLRGSNEPLEDEESPYFHVGGAGTHFPRRDGTGKPIFASNLHTPLEAPGPWKLVDQKEILSDEAIQRLLGVMGFDGEWFDAREVEEYLKTKGIYLDGHSSFIDIDTSRIAPVNPPPLVMTLTGDSVSTITPSTPGMTPGREYPNNNLVIQDANTSFDSNFSQGPFVGKGVAPVPDRGYGWTNATAVNDTNHANVNTMPPYEHMARRRGFITLDVAKFLERVVYGGACFGRAPGYRRKAIDEALELALQESF